MFPTIEMRQIAIPAAFLSVFAGGVSLAAVPADESRRVPRISAVRATADAYVTTTSAAANYGRQRVLFVDEAPKIWTFIRFAVDMKRGHSRVRRVNLLVYSRTRSRRGYQVRGVRKSWREQRITFENAPRASSRFVSSGPVRANAWKAVDVTSLVDDDEDEVSFALTTAGRQRIELASRESGTKGPRLVLERDVPDGQTAPATTEPNDP